MQPTIRGIPLFRRNMIAKSCPYFVAPNPPAADAFATDSDTVALNVPDLNDVTPAGIAEASRSQGRHLDCDAGNFAIDLDHAP